MSSLKGKTILITGGSRGIGEAIAVRCAKDGANVVIAAKTTEPHPKLPGTIYTAAEAVEAAGGKALALKLDVRDADRSQEVIEKTVEHFGGLDILVNNAGAINLVPLEDLEVKRYDLMMDINVRAVFLMSKFALPYLKKSDNAHILNLSPPVEVDAKWLKNHTPYTISKFGMSLMTLGMSAELEEYNIAANSLWPRTTIATAAVNMLGGQEMMDASRTPEIMADAAYEIFRSPSKELSGNFLVDEDFLRTRGYTDFEKYRINPDKELVPDLYISDASPLH